jgi:hypothetical protein
MEIPTANSGAVGQELGINQLMLFPVRSWSFAAQQVDTVAQVGGVPKVSVAQEWPE